MIISPRICIGNLISHAMGRCFLKLDSSPNLSTIPSSPTDVVILTLMEFGTSPLIWWSLHQMASLFPIWVTPHQTRKLCWHDCSGIATCHLPSLVLSRCWPYMGRWFEESLDEAARLRLHVYLIGHPPLTTKEGRDEMDVGSQFYRRFKTLLSAYSSIIKVGLFGHHNYAFVEEILSTSYLPLIPSIIAPGISPRGKNNPAFHVIYRSKETGTILDFKQMKFDLFLENQMAQVVDLPSYLGHWSFYSDRLHSWRSLRFPFPLFPSLSFPPSLPPSPPLFLP